MEKELPKEGTKVTTSELEGINHFEGIIGDTHKDRSYAEQKFIALFKARTVLAKIGTMEERRICKKKLKQMKKKGLLSV